MEKARDMTSGEFEITILGVEMFTCLANCAALCHLDLGNVISIAKPVGQPFQPT